MPGWIPDDRQLDLDFCGQEALEFGVDVVDNQVTHWAGRRGHGHVDLDLTIGVFQPVDEAKINDVRANFRVGDELQRMAQRFDEGSDALLRRGVTLKPAELHLLLGIPGHCVSRSPLSILTILDSVRLLN